MLFLGKKGIGMSRRIVYHLLILKIARLEGSVVFGRMIDGARSRQGGQNRSGKRNLYAGQGTH
jgi:hypothetical protein